MATSKHLFGQREAAGAGCHVPARRMHSHHVQAAPGLDGGTPDLGDAEARVVAVQQRFAVGAHEHAGVMQLRAFLKHENCLLCHEPPKDAAYNNACSCGRHSLLGLLGNNDVSTVLASTASTERSLQSGSR
jgi:hypothetical protein